MIYKLFLALVLGVVVTESASAQAWAQNRVLHNPPKASKESYSTYIAVFVIAIGAVICCRQRFGGKGDRT